MGALETFGIRKCVTDSIIDTCSSMLSIEIEPLEEEPHRESRAQRMAGTLHFAGAVTGILNLQVAVDFGRIMAANLLGRDPLEVDLKRDVQKLIAEITSLVGDDLKSALHDAGHVCMISAPCITHGSDFTIQPPAMDRFERCLFRKDNHQLMIEVGLKAAVSADTGIDFSTPDAMKPAPNVDREKLNAIDYPEQVSGAMLNVFETMFALQLEAAETASSASWTGRRYVSSVCFAGAATGIVNVHIDRELSRRVTAQRWGMQPEEIEAEDKILDVLAEIGNRVGGNLQSALTDMGLRCALSSPTVTSGSDFMIEIMSPDRYERTAFSAEGHPLFAEIGVKTSERTTDAVPSGKTIHPPVKDAAADRRPEPPQADGIQPVSTPGSGTAEQPRREKTPTPPQSPAAAGAAKSAPSPEDFALDMLVDIPIELTVELGRTRLPIHDLLKLQPGSAVKLARLEGEPVDILANDILIARGEVVVRNEKYGIRITEITRRADRLKGLS